MPRRSFRRAVAASVLIHAALAGLLAGLLEPAPPRPAPLDTGVDVRIVARFADETVEVAAPTPAAEVVEPVAKKVDEPPKEVAKREKPEELTGGLRPPLARSVPNTLPPEMLAVIRRPAAEPVGGDVVEVNVTPVAAKVVEANPPVAGAGSPPVAHAPGSPSAPPIHAALPAAKTIVYVLDASGSMGEWGKLSKAKAALVATLRGQPATVRFQVVVYNGTARALSAGLVPATDENVRRAEDALRGVEPVGRSDHAEGLRVALALRPDAVLILTDADDLPAAKLKAATARAEKRAAVSVAPVTADGVGRPRELR